MSSNDSCALPVFFRWNFRWFFICAIRQCDRLDLQSVNSKQLRDSKCNGLSSVEPPLSDPTLNVRSTMIWHDMAWCTDWCNNIMSCISYLYARICSLVGRMYSNCSKIVRILPTRTRHGCCELWILDNLWVLERGKSNSESPYLLCFTAFDIQQPWKPLEAESKNVCWIIR